MYVYTFLLLIDTMLKKYRLLEEGFCWNLSRDLHVTGPPRRLRPLLKHEHPDLALVAPFF